MKNYLIDAGLWSFVEPRTGVTVDPEMDDQALAKFNFPFNQTAR